MIISDRGLRISDLSGALRWTALAWLLATAFASAEPLRLHPQNPHYFLFRGKPAVLVTSGEHYGAVVNADFKYEVYLDTLWY